jgi:hypothetical protein
MSRSLGLAFHVDDHGAAATSRDDQLVREQIEQLLFTIPGERVDRPDFGCGIQLLVFEAANPQTAAATEYVVRTSLVRFMSDVIEVEGVRVRTADAELIVEILYTVVATSHPSAMTVRHPLEAPS